MRFLTNKKEDCFSNRLFLRILIWTFSGAKTFVCVLHPVVPFFSFNDFPEVFLLFFFLCLLKRLIQKSCLFIPIHMLFSFLNILNTVSQKCQVRSFF